jgi:hypothetical protein
VKWTARFAISLLALFLITGWILSLWFGSAAERHALLVSGILAAAIQVATFLLAIITRRQNHLLVGWGLGIIIRFTFLVLYGLFLAKALGLPLAAALVSFALFLFVSMLLETILISYAG